MKTVKYWACGHLTITTRATPPPPQLGAKKEKKYCIDWEAYRKITSGVHILFSQKKYNPQFLTLTSRLPIHPVTFVHAQYLFLKNAKKTYNLNQYVWVLEYHQSGQPHTHIVADIDFFDPEKLQTAWNTALISAIRKYTTPELFDNSPYTLIYSETSTLRLPKKDPTKKKKYDNDLETAQGMGKYMAKYAAKAVRDNVFYPCRCYGVSRNIDTTPINISYYDLTHAIARGEIDLKSSKWMFLSENVEIFNFYDQKDKLFQLCSVY
jgi:hypothetical protein